MSNQAMAFSFRQNWGQFVEKYYTDEHITNSKEHIPSFRDALIFQAWEESMKQPLFAQ